MDLHEVVRNPVYLGQLLAALGFALFFGSWIGILLLPVWTICFLVAIRIREEHLERTLGRVFLEYEARVPGRLVPGWLIPGRRAMVRYPYKNLVFKGGGVRGIAYMGVLEVLEKEGVLPQVERVAGSSVGAITATLVCFRLSADETIETARSLDYTKIRRTGARDGRRPRRFKRLQLVPDEAICLERLNNEFGWYSSEFIYEWLKGVVAAHCDGNGLATFADFEKRGFRELYVVASNLMKRQAEVFSAKTTPGVAVADAVRMSISIPLFFAAMRFDGRRLGRGDLYVDGGVYNNYPISLFDAPEYAEGNTWYRNGINWETLGCFLYPQHDDGEPTQEPRNLRAYIRAVLANIYDAYQVMIFENSWIEQRRTIKIPDCEVSAIEFDVGPSSTKYSELIESGRSATREYLRQQSLP